MTTDLDIPPGFYLADGKPMISWFAALELWLMNDRPVEIVARICDSTRCLNVARFETWWPAPTSQIKCGACAAMLRATAEAMGFELVTKELEPPIGLIEDDSAKRFALMELA